MPADYSKAVIYIAFCVGVEELEFYVGATTDLPRVIALHKSNWQNLQVNTKFYKYIRDHGGFENCVFHVVEEFPCIDGDALFERRLEYMEALKPKLNRSRYTTDTYYMENKDKRNQYQKEYNKKKKIEKEIRALVKETLLENANL